MLCKRMLIVLGGCFLASGATWADGVAYVDCASHPEVTQVFGKPRRTPETVAGIPCGERFTILQYGFIFSRIQTKDGQVGYVYSNLISADRSGAAVAQPTPARVNAAPSPTPAATTTVAPPNANPPAQQQAAPIQPSAAQTTVAVVDATKATASPVQSNGTPVQSSAAPATQTQTADQPVPVPAQVTATAPSAPETRVTADTPPSATPEQPHLPPAPEVLIEAAAPAATATEAPKTVDAPETSTAQPEPAPAQPAPAVRNANLKESWEKPKSVARTVGTRNVGMPRLPLIELFGGYGFARLDNGAGTISNSNGVLGSFGWNIKPWLQLIADSSYNRVTVSGTKNVLYGNHWGVRYFRRLRHTWGAAPFVEGLIGGSRADTTVSGTGGYSTSNNCLSYKIGGGVDMRPLKHFEIRVIDFDYYRTSFGTNLHQNNYFISTGIVMRLFGRSEE